MLSDCALAEKGKRRRHANQERRRRLTSLRLIFDGVSENFISDTCLRGAFRFLMGERVTRLKLLGPKPSLPSRSTLALASLLLTTTLVASADFALKGYEIASGRAVWYYRRMECGGS